MKTTSPSPSAEPLKGLGRFRPLLLAWIVLVGAVSTLFWKSLLPEFVLFANDAPLGALHAEAGRLPGTFLGFWQDLNWVGSAMLGATPNLSQILGSLVGSALFVAKFYVPLSLVFLGLSCWFFVRRLGFRSEVAILSGIAAALASNPVSYACWGLPAKAFSLGFTLLALAALSGQESGWRRWLALATAGLATGLNVSEGGDIGAILSLYLVGSHRNTRKTGQCGNATDGRGDFCWLDRCPRHPCPRQHPNRRRLGHVPDARERGAAVAVRHGD